MTAYLLIHENGAPVSINRDISYEEYADVQNGKLTIIRFHNGKFQELDIDLTWIDVPQTMSEVP